MSCEAALADLERELRALIFWIKLRYGSDAEFAIYCNKLARQFNHLRGEFDAWPW